MFCLQRAYLALCCSSLAFPLPESSVNFSNYSSARPLLSHFPLVTSSLVSSLFHLKKKKKILVWTVTKRLFGVLAANVATPLTQAPQNTVL